jgi:hypothetical protein
VPFLVLDQTGRGLLVRVVVGLVLDSLMARMILAGITPGLVAVPFAGGGCRVTLTESLILAQDERWRRA